MAPNTVFALPTNTIPFMLVDNLSRYQNYPLLQLSSIVGDCEQHANLASLGGIPAAETGLLGTNNGNIGVV